MIDYSPAQKQLLSFTTCTGDFENEFKVVFFETIEIMKNPAVAPVKETINFEELLAFLEELD